MIEAPEREDPPYESNEREMLTTWLDYHRATLATKCAGLSDELLAHRSVPPSDLSLLGLIRHMAEVEQSWFDYVVGRRRPLPYSTDERHDADFEDAGQGVAADDVANWQRACAESREVAARHSLDDTFVSRRGQTISLRWVLFHMIEEYARHNGHADLLRECVDGVTGE